jgi:hypothetical protein
MKDSPFPSRSFFMTQLAAIANRMRFRQKTAQNRGVFANIPIGCALLICAFLARSWPASAQSTPAIQITPITSAYMQLSWPTNFAGWQLQSTTNLLSPNSWQSASATPINLGNIIMAIVSATNRITFFRLQSSNSSCIFQATPPVIVQGQSSTLSWCPISGTTYTLTPGPGIVLSSNLVVSPTVTTIYMLIASNIAGIVTNYATVSVSPHTCDFASVRTWDCTLNFSYAHSASSSSYSYNVNQQGNLTFHLTPSTVTINTAVFTGDLGGNAQINDLQNDLAVPPPNNITIVSGSAVPVSGSHLELDIDCNNGTYTLIVTPAIYADWTQNGTVSLLTTVGNVNIIDHPLPSAFGTISGSGSIPAHGPLYPGSSTDFYRTGGLGQNMFTTGTVSESNGGTVDVSWTLVPTP